MIERISLVLEPPLHGWMRVRFELDQFVIDEHVSRVLNDPIDELITVVRDAHRDPKPYVRTCLWFEPAGCAIDVTRGSNAKLCLVRIGEGSNVVPPMQGLALRELYEGEIKANRLRTALRSGLVALLRDENRDALSNWRRDGDWRAYAGRLHEASKA